MPRKVKTEGRRADLIRSRKRQVRPPKIREARSVVVSFRLRKTEADVLFQNLRDKPIANVDSVKQFARKLTLDYLHGRTVYVVAADRRVDPDVRRNLRVETDCDLADKRFVKALMTFLSTAQNWCKLRYFMLRAGWPVELLERYSRATTDTQRLAAVQTMLKRMLTASPT